MDVNAAVFFASYTDNAETPVRSASQTNDIRRDVSSITPNISIFFLISNVCSACFLCIWNVTCCPHHFSVLNCHVWNRCTSKVFFLWIWRSVGASGRSLFENTAGIKNGRKLLVFLPRPELIHSLHIELNLFLPVLLSLFMAKTMWLSMDVAWERRANSNFHLPTKECVFFCSSRLRNVELEGWNEIGSLLVSHSLRTVLAVLTWKFIHSIAITLKCTLHIILLKLLVSVTLHKNNQGRYY